MNCKEFKEMIDSYLCDELLTETNHGVLNHLEKCADCRGVIEARRAVRTRLKSVVINFEEYLIDDDFRSGLERKLKAQILSKEKIKPRFGFGYAFAAAAVLLIVFTLGFFVVGNFNNAETPELVAAEYTTDDVSMDNLVNVAFGDHQFCAIKGHPDHPTELVETPAKYKDIEQIAISRLDAILVDYDLRSWHTCKYKNVAFTHLVVRKNNIPLSLMLTEKSNAERIAKGIDYYSTAKFQMARFDVYDTSVFVVSELDKKMNSRVAESLYEPISKHFADPGGFQAAIFDFY